MSNVRRITIRNKGRRKRGRDLANITIPPANLELGGEAIKSPVASIERENQEGGEATNDSDGQDDDDDVALSSADNSLSDV